MNCITDLFTTTELAACSHAHDSMVSLVNSYLWEDSEPTMNGKLLAAQLIALDVSIRPLERARRRLAPLLVCAGLTDWEWIADAIDTHGGTFWAE